jgi:PIN domain nuclease of toxin-antitoxin system
MNLLLDTHALLWFFAGDPQLNQAAVDAITNEANTVTVSAVSIQEIAVKVRIGKLQMDLQKLTAWIDEFAFERISFEDDHAVELSRLPALPGHHDPFDLMLIAQAIVEKMTLVTSDGRIIGHYPIGILGCKDQGCVLQP